MIIDTSALISIAFREAGYEGLLDRIHAAGSVAAGTPTLAETGIVLQGRLGTGADGMLERLLDVLGVQEIPFGELHWREAVEAHRKFGKGRHKANLNFCDCMTYATAKLSASPLLYVGADFDKTDLPAA